jgi:Flp pilus assembly protein TadG
MNKHPRHSQSGLSRKSNGQAMVEMAMALPVLALLLLAAADFGRLYYANIEVANAARAGAQYGSQSVITAANLSGMETAAKTDGSNLSALSATAKQCTCVTTSSVAACPSSYCTNNPQATFVEVDTATTFHTAIKYPGIPSAMTLGGKAVMMVAQ